MVPREQVGVVAVGAWRLDSERVSVAVDLTERLYVCKQRTRVSMLADLVQRRLWGEGCEKRCFFPIFVADPSLFLLNNRVPRI